MLTDLEALGFGILNIWDGYILGKEETIRLQVL